MNHFLTPHQRQVLFFQHKVERMRRLADRIKAILLLDDGLTYEEIAAVLFLDDNTIRCYEETYKAKGLEGLLDDAYKGGTTKLNSLDEEELKVHLNQVTYLSTKEIIVYVEKEYGVEFTPAGMRHLLKRLGFRYIKPKVVPGKANLNEQAEFLAQYEALKASLAKEDKIYFADACHPLHNALAAYGWMPKGQPKILKTNSGRNRINLHGAVEVSSLDIVMHEEGRVNSDATLKLLASLEARNPEAKAIYFICDNASYYHAKVVKKWLESSRIKIVYLPAYSPNLNIIERLWKYFRAKVMANTYYPPFPEFRHNTREFFRGIRHRKHELASLLVDRFQIFKTI